MDGVILPVKYSTGFIRQPKWGHLRSLHHAIKLCEEPLVNSQPNHVQLGNNLEVNPAIHLRSRRMSQRKFDISGFSSILI